jgi:hypothetical protein
MRLGVIPEGRPAASPRGRAEEPRLSCRLPAFLQHPTRQSSGALERIAWAVEYGHRRQNRGEKTAFPADTRHPRLASLATGGEMEQIPGSTNNYIHLATCPRRFTFYKTEHD